MMEPNNLLQLRAALQPILDAALRPILNALEALDERVAGLDERVAGLDERVAGLDERVAGLDEKVQVLDTKLTGLDERVAGLDERVAGLDERVAGLDEKVQVLDTKLTGLQMHLKISDAKAINAQIGRSEPLLRVSLNDGSYPIIPGSRTQENVIGTVVEYPTTISHLLVAGNETLPDGGLNNWNKKKSSMLLQAFGEESDNDTDREDGPTSRRRRLKVGKLLGVTKTQLNFAQMTL
jgi:uncharacterized coiled-coil protein SlyX